MRCTCDSGTRLLSASLKQNCSPRPFRQTDVLFIGTRFSNLYTAMCSTSDACVLAAPDRLFKKVGSMRGGSPR